MKEEIVFVYDPSEDQKHRSKDGKLEQIMYQRGEKLNVAAYLAFFPGTFVFRVMNYVCHRPGERNTVEYQKDQSENSQ